MGSLSAYFLYKSNSKFFATRSKRIASTLALTIGLSCFISGFASYINYTFVNQNYSCENMILKDCKSNYNYVGKHDHSHEYFIIANIRGNKQKIMVPRTIYKSLKTQKNVEICFSHGILGFDQISTINKLNYQ